MGFPVGRFEGDTLVIRTVGLTDTTVLDASGLPHSDQMVLTERLRVLPDGRLENRMTIEDPDTFTSAWETVLTFHRDPAARVTDDVCPDRLAKGEPAELLTKPSPPTAAAAAAARRSETRVQATVAAPRFTGMWEAEDLRHVRARGGSEVHGQRQVALRRNAAAMKSGHIMQTAWTSCRPGAVSTMTMPRERILVLEIPRRDHDPLRDAANGPAHPHECGASEGSGAELRGSLHRPVGGRHAGRRQHRLQRLCRTRCGWPADEPAAAHGRALHARCRRQHRH